MGFDWGNMAVERCFDAGGHQCVRIRAMTTGKYIDVQMSAGGRNMFINESGQTENLKGFDPCGGKKKIFQIEGESDGR